MEMVGLWEFVAGTRTMQMRSPLSLLDPAGMKQGRKEGHHRLKSGERTPLAVLQCNDPRAVKLL